MLARTARKFFRVRRIATRGIIARFVMATGLRFAPDMGQIPCKEAASTKYIREDGEQKIVRFRQPTWSALNRRTTSTPLAE